MAQYQALWLDALRVTWRDLTWGEYNRLAPYYLGNAPAPQMTLALKVYELCCLSGPALADVPAGIPVFLLHHQFRANPFGGRYEDVKRALDLTRAGLGWLEAAQARIAAAFRVSFADLQAMDPGTFFTRLAQAELLLGKLDPLDPQAKNKQPEPSDPNAPPRNRPPLDPAKARAIQIAKERRRQADRSESRR